MKKRMIRRQTIGAGHCGKQRRFIRCTRMIPVEQKPSFDEAPFADPKFKPVKIATEEHLPTQCFFV